MKTLIVYYSRTGNTKKVAELLASQLEADIEGIVDTVGRSGIRGYLISGRDAMKKRLTKLEPSKYNPADYELVIVGTPIWGWNMSVPVRTYLTEQKNNFQAKIAYFCTMNGAGDQQAFQEMEDVSGQKPVTTLTILARELAKEEINKKIDKFVENLSP